MRNPWKSGMACAMCASIALTLAPSETLAGVMSVPDKAIIAPPSPVDQVHYRRHHHRHWRHYHHHHWRPYYPRRHRYHRYYYRYGYDPGGALFGAAALGLMAGAISAATAPRYYGWGYPGYGWGRPAYWGGGWGYRPWGYRPWGWGW